MPSPAGPGRGDLQHQGPRGPEALETSLWDWLETQDAFRDCPPLDSCPLSFRPSDPNDATAAPTALPHPPPPPLPRAPGCSLLARHLQSDPQTCAHLDGWLVVGMKAAHLGFGFPLWRVQPRLCCGRHVAGAVCQVPPPERLPSSRRSRISYNCYLSCHIG